MRRWRWHLIGGGALALVGVALLLVAFLGRGGGVARHIASTYERVPSASSDRTYRSPSPPDRVAADISAAWPPAQRITDPGGFFLRYRDDIVGVVPDGRGGSQIYVDDEDRGYARWYPYVGGRWGTYSGVGERFRGGGPGAGK